MEDGVDWDEDNRRALAELARHEAGHAAVFEVVGAEVQFIAIERDGGDWEGGVVQPVGRDMRDLSPTAQAACHFAGTCAERFCADGSVEASDARELVLAERAVPTADFINAIWSLGIPVTEVTRNLTEEEEYTLEDGVALACDLLRRPDVWRRVQAIETEIVRIAGSREAAGADVVVLHMGGGPPRESYAVDWRAGVLAAASACYVGERDADERPVFVADVRPHLACQYSAHERATAHVRHHDWLDECVCDAAETVRRSIFRGSDAASEWRVDVAVELLDGLDDVAILDNDKVIALNPRLPLCCQEAYVQAAIVFGVCQVEAAKAPSQSCAERMGLASATARVAGEAELADLLELAAGRVQAGSPAGLLLRAMVAKMGAAAVSGASTPGAKELGHWSSYWFTCTAHIAEWLPELQQVAFLQDDGRADAE